MCIGPLFTFDLCRLPPPGTPASLGVGSLKYTANGGQVTSCSYSDTSCAVDTHSHHQVVMHYQLTFNIYMVG
jgi:hypothetical protein